MIGNVNNRWTGGWKGRLLSIGGRISLTNSVLFAISNYIFHTSTCLFGWGRESTSFVVDFISKSQECTMRIVDLKENESNICISNSDGNC